jgi:thiol-disulfide isomerase/thioredoxin
MALELALDCTFSAIPSFLPLFAAALLYAAVPANATDLASLRTGEMRKLVVHETPVPVPDEEFTAADGAPTTLAASNGRVRLVNFWATWCAPCRKEMPALDALQRDRGGPDFEVITIATGRNSPEGIAAFREEAGITDLPNALDPKGRLAAAMGVPGLPVSVLLDREGSEVARMMGDADWNGPDAHALIDVLVGTGESREMGEAR